MYIIFLLIITFIFNKSLFVYFAQDDFFFLFLSKINTFSDFFKLFIPQVEVVWYRPLSSPIFFYFCRLLFGFNPFGYHLVTFLFHALTAFSLFKLNLILFKSKKIGLLASLIYSMHQMHTVSLSWVATLSFIVGPLFIILTLLLYSKKKYFWAIFIYLLGIFSSEMLLLFPIILFLFQLFIEEKRKIKLLFPYLIICFIIIILRFVFFKVEMITDSYSIRFNIETLNLFKFYIFRIIGVPMLFVKLTNTLKIFTIILVFLFCSSIFFGFVMSWRNHLITKKIVFLALSGLIFLIPFLFMPNHIAPYYLSYSHIYISSIFAIFIYIGSNYLSKIIRSYYLLIILVIFLLNQIIGINLTYNTHWIFNRAKLAKILVEQKKLLQPIGSEEFFSLGGDNAYKFFNK